MKCINKILLSVLGCGLMISGFAEEKKAVTEENFKQVSDGINGEILRVSANATFARQISRNSLDIISARLNGKSESKFDIWATGFGGKEKCEKPEEGTKNKKEDEEEQKSNKNKQTDENKLTSTIYGVVLGADTNINENLTVGLFGSFTKGKSEYNLTENNKTNKLLDSKHKAYFGGIYGRWMNLDETLKITVDAFGGRIKSDDKMRAGDYDSLPNLNDENAAFSIKLSDSFDTYKTKANVFGAGLNVTYTPLNVYGFNVGPWFAVDYTHLREKAYNLKLISVSDNFDVNTKRQTVDMNIKSRKQNITDVIVGIAGEYDMGPHKFMLNLGFGHEFSNGGKTIKGDVTINTYDKKGEKPTSKTVKDQNFDGYEKVYGKNKFVGKASYVGTFGQFGLSAHIATDLRKKTKGFYGGLTASYSF